MIKKLFVYIILTFILSISCTVFAKPVEYTAMGVYALQANDTRETAKKQAVKAAIRQASEMGAVYVESYSKTNNFQLTKDEIEIVTASIVKVYDEKISYENNGMICKAIIFCSVDTDNIDLKKILTKYRNGKGKQNSTKKYKKPTIRYTGIIIDCHDADPAKYLILNGSGDAQTVIKAEDGRIVYDVMTPEPKRGYSIVYPTRGYDERYHHAGDNPYWATALYVEEPIGKPARFSGRIVISNADADEILAQQQEFGLLNGDDPPVVVIKHL